MSDQYDLYCFQKLGEVPAPAVQSDEVDEVTCACANYLSAEGYNVSHPEFAASAAQLVPTTTNLKGVLK